MNTTTTTITNATDDTNGTATAACLTPHTTQMLCFQSIIFSFSGGCRQAFEDGLERWCSISSPEYNQVKCKEVNDNAPVFDQWLRLNSAEREQPITLKPTMILLVDCELSRLF